MKSFSLSSYAITGGVALALLAGCGGSQSLIGAPRAPQLTVRQSLPLPAASGDASSPQYKTSGPLLYVSNDGEAHNVTVYRADAKDPSPIATISDDLEFPAGTCVDGQGTLYVADQTGWIAEYPAGKTKPSKVITKGTDNPGYCAIDSQGNLWVTNPYGPDVTEYLRGSTKPHTVITKGLTYPVGLAIDQSGNIYVGNGGYNGFGPYSILVYASGKKSPSRTITDGVTAPNGIAADAQDTLYVANHIANNVEKYRSGQNHPYQTITDGLNRPTGIAVNKQGWLYVVNNGYTGDFVIAEYPPGSTTPSSRQISKGLYEPFDTAYSPALLP
jgi:sugar lactone lactonase YvrE